MKIRVTYDNQEETIVVDAGECSVTISYLDNASVTSEVKINAYISPVVDVPHSTILANCMIAFDLWSEEHANETGQLHDNEPHSEYYIIA